MTAKITTSVFKGWEVTPEMLKRLPELMFELAGKAEDSSHDRAAAARILVAMTRQENDRANAENPAGYPAVPVDLPENGRAAREAES